MEKTFLTLLLLIMAVMPAMAAPINTSGPWGISVSGFKNLSSAVVSPSTAGKTITIDKVVTCNNLTIPSDRSINMVRGGRIDVNTGKTLTINGPFDSGLFQSLGGGGAISFSGGRTIYKEWSGVNNNATPIHLSATTENGVLGTEILTNGTFATGAAGWTLTNFTADTGITHTVGLIGTASQTITIPAYTTGLLSVTVNTTAPGYIDFRFNNSSLMDDTIAAGNGSYYLNTGTATYELSTNMLSADTTASFVITTDTAWAGTITNISYKPVTRMPFTISQRAQDDPTGRIPQGIKFGRFNAGNIAIGDSETMSAIDSGQYGAWNIAIGPRSQAVNRLGYESTSVGAFALRNNNAPRQTAFGYSAGKVNTIGTNLTAIGYKSFASNTSGNRNTGVGFHSALQTVAGSDNTAIGYQALYSNLTGFGNVVLGSQAGQNTAGSENTIIGGLAGLLNTDVNITYPYNQTTSIGSESKAYGDFTTVLGFQATAGSSGAPITNATAIGKTAYVSTSNTVQIGNTDVVRWNFGSHSISWASTAPTTGTWAQGDRIFNSSAIVGQPKGWACTVAGTPGTWVSEGNL